MTNQTQESVGVQEVWSLNIAVEIETMETESLQERDYGENRIVWSVPQGITIIRGKLLSI